jgi:hypothetical protein
LERSRGSAAVLELEKLETKPRQAFSIRQVIVGFDMDQRSKSVAK